MILNKILESYPDEKFLIADGFDTAVIGVELSSGRLIYSTLKIKNILIKDMSEDDALEYFVYNIEGSYHGEKTPIWCDDDFYSLCEIRKEKLETLNEKIENCKNTE